MLKHDKQRRRKQLPTCFRAEIEGMRQQFFTAGETGTALTTILKYAKLPSNLNVCERAFAVAAEVVCAWMRELPRGELSPADRAHRCAYTAARVQHARNWGNCLLSRTAPERRRTCDKDIFATRFITTVRDAAIAALPVLQGEQAKALRATGSGTTRAQATLFSN